MLTISVPYAPLLYKILLGIPLLIFCVLALRWGGKNLDNCVRMLQGRMPLPKGSSWPFVIVGVVFYAGVLAVGAFFCLFLIAMQTTSPTIVSENGIVPGAGPPFYRHKLIAWRDVTKVTCNLPPRENRVRIITIYSHESGLQMGNAGVALEGVLNVMKAKAPKGTVRPCEHGALDHFWSY